MTRRKPCSWLSAQKALAAENMATVVAKRFKRKEKDFVSNRVLQTFQNSSGSHATADAHGYHAIARIAPLQFAQNGRRKFGAGTAQRMTKRYGASVWIDPRRIKPRLLDHRQ